MAFGTIYTHNPNPRTTAILIIARAHGLDLNIVFADRDDTENYEKLLKLNPLGQVPTFVGADGWVLSECIPLTLYITSQSPTTALLGSTQRDYYEILRWMSFVNGDFLPSIGGCILPLIGRHVVIRKNTEDCLRAFYRHCKLIDDHLKNREYLVGDSFTVADIFTASMVIGAFKVFHPEVHKYYRSFTRWFYHVYNTPMFKDVVGEIELLDLDYPKLPTEEVNLEVDEKVIEQSRNALTAGRLLLL